MADEPEDKAPKVRTRTPRSRTSAKVEAPPVESIAKPKPRKRAGAPGKKPAASPPPGSKARKAKSGATASDQGNPENSGKAKPTKRRSPRKPVARLDELPLAFKAAAPEQVLAPEAPVAPADAMAPSAEPHDEALAEDIVIHPVEAHDPSAHKHDEGLEFGLSPVDLPPDARVREDAGLGWFASILVMTSAMLVLFNSFAIDKWAREQPVTPYNSRILIAAQQLHGEMKSFHLDAPLEAMRSVWRGIRAAQWPGAGSDAAKPASDRSPAK